MCAKGKSKRESDKLNIVSLKNVCRFLKKAHTIFHLKFIKHSDFQKQFRKNN
jgi:hypothetical protein